MPSPGSGRRPSPCARAYVSDTPSRDSFFTTRPIDDPVAARSASEGSGCVTRSPSGPRREASAAAEASLAELLLAQVDHPHRRGRPPARHRTAVTDVAEAAVD